MSDPLSFFTETYPALFAAGVAALTEQSATDPKAKSRLADIQAASGAAHLVLEGDGGGDVWLVTKDGAMTAERAAPTVPVRLAFAVPMEAATAGLALLNDEGVLDRPDAKLRIAGIASKRAEDLMAKEKIGFHVILKDVPELDTVTVKVGLGLADPPATPGFTATVSWNSLEDLRAGDLTPQQLFFNKTKIVGDASRAMTLVMSAMQRK